MRRLTIGLLALTLVATPAAVRADDPSAFKELLDKAAKAQGGADKAAKMANLAIKGKGQVNEGGMVVDLAFEMSFKEIDRARVEMTINAGGMVKKGTFVIADGKGWARDSEQDKVEEAPAEAIPLMQSIMLATRAPGMPAALAARKDLTLAHAGEGKVDDTPAEVLRISRKDQPDITIYFDKKTGLPLKSETQLKEPNGEEKPFVFLFSDFKEFDGVKHYTKIKISRDGKEMVEMELSELKPGAKFEANAFDKP